MLMHACDFQICAGWSGLIALDFEPTAWLMRVHARGLRKPGV